MSRSDFCHYFNILIQYSREIHHFAEITDIISFKQPANILAIECSSRSFEIGCRNTTWCPEVEVERNLPAIFDHEIYTFHSTDIGNFMRITYRSDCSVSNRQPCKLRRDKHGTFNM